MNVSILHPLASITAKILTEVLCVLVILVIYLIRMEPLAEIWMSVPQVNMYVSILVSILKVATAVLVLKDTLKLEMTVKVQYYFS